MMLHNQLTPVNNRTNFYNQDYSTKPPKNRISRSHINSKLNLVALASKYVELTHSGKWASGPCPICNDGHDRFVINTTTDRWLCRKCSPTYKDAVNLFTAINDCSFLECAAYIDPTSVRNPTRIIAPRKTQKPLAGQPNGQQKQKNDSQPEQWNDGKNRYVTDVFEYVATDGTRLQKVKLVGRKERYYSWRHWNNGGWWDGLGGATPQPYQWEQVVGSKTVWFFEGEKDARNAAFANVDGLPIAFVSLPFGATSPLNDADIDQLKAVGCSALVTYDVDSEGIAGATKLLARLTTNGIQAEIINLPSLVDGYDVSDFLLEKELTDLLAKRQVVVPNGQYLSDVAFTLPNRCLLVAQTGIGKSTYALNRDNNPVVFAVPTIALAQQLHAKTDGTDIYCGSDPTLQTADEQSRKIICTYDSLHKAMQLVDIASSTLVIDEIHATAASGGYRSKTLDNALDHIQAAWNNVILLTGTPFPFSDPRLFGFTTVNVKSDIRPQPATVVGWSEQATKKQTLRANVDPTMRHVIYLNDKGNGLSGVIAMLHAAGFTDEQILTFNADNRSENAQTAMVESGIVDDRIRVLICTSIATEGLSIYSDFDHIHLYSRLNPLSAQQFVNRFRNRAANVYLYSDGVDNGKRFDVSSAMRFYASEAQSLLERFQTHAPNPNDDSTTAFIKSRSQREIIANHGKLIRVDSDNEIGKLLDDKRYAISHSGVDNATFEAMTTYCYHNPNAYKAELLQYGWVFGPNVTSAGLAEPANEISERQAIADEREKVHAAIVEAIKPISSERAAAIAKRGSDEHTKPVVSAVRECVKMASGADIDYSQAVDIYERNPSKRGRNREIKQLNIQTARAAGESIVCAFYDAFTVGQRYTSDEIHAIVTSVAKVDGLTAWVTERPDRLTKTQCTRILGNFFEVKRVSVGQLGEKAYELVNDNPCRLVEQGQQKQKK